jgi:hypothetical protein
MSTSRRGLAGVHPEKVREVVDVPARACHNESGWYQGSVTVWAAVGCEASKLPLKVEAIAGGTPYHLWKAYYGYILASLRSRRQYEARDPKLALQAWFMKVRNRYRPAVDTRDHERFVLRCDDGTHAIGGY